MIKRILVGLAGTTYTPVAIQRAVTLAQSHAADVTGVTVLDPRRVRSAEAPIVKSIRAFQEACETAGIKHRVIEESGDVFTSLVDEARYHDLMIFGLRSLFDQDFIGGDPESLLIRLVNAGARPMIAVSEQFRSISRVLVAYDGTMESAKAMKRFVQMQLWPDAELKIVTFQESESVAFELLQAAEDYCRAHGYQVCHQSYQGDPKVLLLGAATLWQADMIVMGNSARSALLRKVLGDTLLSTLRDSRIPLFLA